MANGVALTGFLVIAASVVLLAAPQVLRRTIAAIQSPRLFYGASSVRVLLGAFFIVASEACAWPIAVGSLGVVTLMIGFAGLFIGPEGLGRLIDCVQGLSDTQWRVMALLPLVSGAFIVCAAVGCG